MWKYSNDDCKPELNTLVEDHGIICRSVACNEKTNFVAFGGCASKVGRLNPKPFISIHRIDNKARFPILDTMMFDSMEGCIANLEWMYLTKQPTLLACDMRTLLVLQFRQNQLVLLQNV